MLGRTTTSTATPATPLQPAASSVRLGPKQRSDDTIGTGLVLMGARVYHPVAGRFTSAYPVPGGNNSPYSYPDDPVNARDLDGNEEEYGDAILYQHLPVGEQEATSSWGSTSLGNAVRGNQIPARGREVYSIWRDDRLVYTGRTQAYIYRLRAHLYSNRGFVSTDTVRFHPVRGGTQVERRLEQRLINQHGFAYSMQKNTPLWNKINSIGPKYWDW